MRTLIISDLHLGSMSGSDVLRRDDLRATLLHALTEVDRLVLLGDVIELRHGPARDALAAARPLFEDLGRALEGRELVITAGNHDHGLVEPWLARRGEAQEPPPLQLEQLLDPSEVSPALARIAGWVSPARLLVAYPGLWVRPDVYATHGHYLDCHLTVPTLERLSVGAMLRLLGRAQTSLHSVDDYEAVGAPLFAWRDVVARSGRMGSVLNGFATTVAWSALGGGGDLVAGSAEANGNGRVRERRRSRGRGRGVARTLRRRALVVGFPLAVAALNRAGLGPLRADVSAAALRRAGLAAMGEVAARLGLGDAYVVFGHTHRMGPLPGDDEREWRGRKGARLVNAGSWTYASIFIDRAPPGESPYWPGASVLVEDDRPPRALQLLGERSRADIAPPRTRWKGPVSP
jgi:Calcineurin-like phosphoesterase